MESQTVSEDLELMGGAAEALCSLLAKYREAPSRLLRDRGAYPSKSRAADPLTRALCISQRH